MSRRRKLPTDRFERESPVIERFEKLTGISMKELDAELPVPTDETASSNARQPDRPAAPAVPAAKPRHSRTYVMLAALAFAGLAGPILRLSSDATTSPAIEWIETDSNLPEIGPRTVSRGNDAVETAGGSVAGNEAAAALDSAWTVLRGARSTWLGLFPRYDAAQVARASDLFEEASRYGVADAAVRGEAVYGVAVTAWLAGDLDLTMAALRQPTISFTEMADNAERMLREVSEHRQE